MERYSHLERHCFYYRNCLGGLGTLLGSKAAAPLALLFSFASALGSPTWGPDWTRAEQQLRNRFKENSDVAERVFDRKGNHTLSVQIFVNLDAPYSRAQEILSKPERYPAWVLRGINEHPRPEEGGYRVRFLQAKQIRSKPPQFEIHTRFELSLFHHDSRRIFEMEYHPQKNRLLVLARHVPTAGAFLESANFQFYVLPSLLSTPNPRTWIYAEGQLKFKSELLYQALPLGVLLSETDHRLDKIVENFFWEDTQK